MRKRTVLSSVLRGFLAEAMANVGSMGHDADPPIVPTATVDRPSIRLDTDAVELRHAPRSRGELLIMVRDLLEDQPDDQAGELYRKIRDVVAGTDRSGEKDFGRGQELSKGSVQEGTKMGKTIGGNLGDIIRTIMVDALEEDAASGRTKKKMTIGGKAIDPSDPENQDEEGPHDDFLARGGSASDEFKRNGALNFDPKEDTIFDDELDADLAALTASEWDPDDDGDVDVPGVPDDDDDKPKRGKSDRTRSATEDHPSRSEGMTLDRIAKELGTTQEGAKKVVDVALERFRVLNDMDPEDLADLVTTGVNDYIAHLVKVSKKKGDDGSPANPLDKEEIAFLRMHPDVVATTDDFRDFFSRLVAKTVRGERALTQDGHPGKKSSEDEDDDEG